MRVWRGISTRQPLNDATHCCVFQGFQERCDRTSDAQPYRKPCRAADTASDSHTGCKYCRTGGLLPEELIGLGMLCDHQGLLDLPSHNPSNFSRCPTPATSRQAPVERPRTYIPTHSTLPPPHQVIHTESQNILLRQFYQLGIHRDSDAMDCSQIGRPKRTAEASQDPSLKRRRADAHTVMSELSTTVLSS